MLGMLGLPPFNMLAWYFGDRDMKAPGFAEMPWIYRTRVRTTRTLGKVGSILMVIWSVIFFVMTNVNALYPRRAGAANAPMSATPTNLGVGTTSGPNVGTPGAP